FSASRSRFPRRARPDAADRSSSDPPDGEDGDVVREGGVGEVACRLEERLAEDVGLDTGIAAEDAGDAILSEQLLAGPRLGQPVGVEEDEVTGIELDLPADVVGPGVEREQRARRP